MSAQTSYSVNPARGVEGLTMGPRKSRPKILPWLAQITTVTSANGAGSTNWAITIVDDETSQSYTVTAAGSATEATLDANMEAAFAAHDVLRNLFTLTVTSVSDVVATFTAKHANRSYTFSATGGTGANTVSVTQAAGGSEIAFGRLVARGAAADEFAAVGASTTVSQLLGVLFRTDANNFRPTDSNNDNAAALDLCERGRTYAIMEEGRVMMVAEDAVTFGGPIFMRRALTGSTGALGRVRGTVAGATGEILTFTPTVDHMVYGFEYGYRGQHYSVIYQATDNTTTVADACAGLEDAADDGNHADVTVSAGGTTAITLTLPVGAVFDYARTSTWGLDTEATSGTTVLSAGDADAIDISSIASFEESASAGALVWVKIHMGAL